MNRRCLFVGLTLVALVGGCGKKKEKPPASDSPTLVKRAEGGECKSLLGSEYGRAIVMGILGEGAGLSVETMEEQELVKECQLIPPKVLSCYKKLDLESPDCDAAINGYLGLRDSTPRHVGPTSSWRFEMEEDWLDLVANDEGMVLVAYEDKVVAIAEGKQVWTRQLDAFSGRLAIADGCVIAPTDRALHCLRFADGKDSWLAPRARAETSRDDMTAFAVAVHKGRALLVGVDGVIYSFDLVRCAKHEACVSDSGIVAGPYSDFYAFAFGDDGYWMLGESEHLRLFDGDDKERWARGGYEADAPTASGPRFVVLSGKDVMQVEAAACKADSSACAKTVATLHDDNAFSAVGLPEGGVAIAREEGVVAAFGSSPWKLDAGNDAALVVVDGLLYSLGSASSLDDIFGPMTLRAIDPKTGETLWMSTLAGRAGLESSIMILAGDSLAIALPNSNELFLVPRRL